MHYYATLQVPLYFILWYVREYFFCFVVVVSDVACITGALTALSSPTSSHLCVSAVNVLYNITNKWALQDIQNLVDIVETKRIHDGLPSHTTTSEGGQSMAASLPITIGCLQFAIGSVYACTLWMLGSRPVPHKDEVRMIANRCMERIRGCISNQHSPSHSYSPLERSYINNTSSSISTMPTLRETSHIAIHHTLGQLCTVLTLAANSISFAHVIKAMEPFFSAIASRFFLGQRMDIRVYLALVPVVGGVMMACAGSNEFSWVSFGFGMGSNAFFAMRAVASKLAMEGSTSAVKRVLREKESNNFLDDSDTTSAVSERTDEKGHPLNTTTMSPSNLFAAVTCMSFIFSVPIGIILEGHILIDLFKFIANGDISNATTNDATIHFTKTIMYVLSSGLFHYLNNEVMYLVLSNVHPITLAVGNTMKRVFIIVAGVLVFSTPVTTSTAIGSTIGIGGVFVYSLMKQWYDTPVHDYDRSEHEDRSEHGIAMGSMSINAMTNDEDNSSGGSVVLDSHLLESAVVSRRLSKSPIMQNISI